MFALRPTSLRSRRVASRPNLSRSLLELDYGDDQLMAAAALKKKEAWKQANLTASDMGF